MSLSVDIAAAHVREAASQWADALTIHPTVTGLFLLGADPGARTTDSARISGRSGSFRNVVISTLSDIGRNVVISTLSDIGHMF